MRACHRHLAFLLLVSFLTTGCSVGHSVGGLVDPFNLLGLGKPPVRIGVTSLELTPPPIIIPKRALFEDNLAFHLGEPVSFDLMTPRQIRVHLGTGRLKFAMLSPADFCEIVEADNSRILAVPANDNGHTYRRGLIIVSARSTVRSLEELKSKRFHFMPKGNSLNEAALGALMEAGITVTKLDKGILGLELDTYHINSLEVAKSVVLEDTAGVIDAADYEKWKDSGGSLVLLSPSKDQVRVIAETVRVPEGPFVVSIHTAPELTEKLRRYLLDEVNKKPLVLSSLGFSKFVEPIDPAEYRAFGELHRRLHPPKEGEAATHPASETKPAP
jgi:ABC-type phosphate/phosphonate transport system substrate-binding protein